MATDASGLSQLAGIARPRWRTEIPALWRDASTLQFGDDVIIHQVQRTHLEWIASLDGLRTSAEVESSLELPVSEAQRLLRALRAAGALDDAARIPDTVRWAAQEERDGAARRFGALISHTRDLDDAYRTAQSQDAVRVAVAGTGPLAAEVRRALPNSGLRECADNLRSTIVVLADSYHPDVPAHFDGPLLDGPHLHVGVLGQRAVVGPLVVPGTTSCLRCAHLSRRDADSAWPALAVQWSQSMRTNPCPPIDDLLVCLAATQALLLVRMWCHLPADRWANRALELRLPDGDGRWVSRPPHPLCGCLWQSQ